MRPSDFRSDTVTAPSEEMRAAIASADVGDDVLDGDPAVRRLEEAAASAMKMTTHNDSDGKVDGYRERWTKVHEITKEWVARMTTLVECWNKLDGNVGELSSWVNKQVRLPHSN